MRFLEWNRRTARIRPPEADARSLPPLLTRVLEARGLTDGASADAFLHAEGPLHDPMLLSGMRSAVPAVLEAVDAGKKILVYGDYDCDGITATVMLYDYLNRSGADVRYYIPERLSEGYGLNRESIDLMKASEISLVITVDNGVSSREEVAYANSLGMDVVITDHHAVPEILPEAAAVLDPHRGDCGYPFRDLSGAGVAFKLIAALEQVSRGGEDAQDMLLRQYGDLLVISILADIVPVTGENRVLAKRGLEVLRNTDRAGLRALAEEAGADLRRCDSETVGFRLAPPINVSGRLGSADLSVELLLTGSPPRARELAAEICALNLKRRSMQESLEAEILEKTAGDPALRNGRVLFVSGRGWHNGIVGVTAGRLARRFRKPSVVVSVENGVAKGSGRSVEGFSLIDAFASAKHLLLKFGGHPMAAGFTLREEDLPSLRKALEEYAETAHPVMPGGGITVDATAGPEEITLESAASLSLLEPFGEGNRMPVLEMDDVLIGRIREMGGGRHLRLTAGESRRPLSFLLFNTRRREFPFQEGDRVDLLFTLRISYYQDEPEPMLRVLNVHPAGFQQEAFFRDEELFERALLGAAEGDDLPSFTREDLASFYRFFRKVCPYPAGRDGLFRQYRKSAPDASHFGFLAAMRILEDCRLLAVRPDGEIVLLPWTEKADLSRSRLFATLQNR